MPIIPQIDESQRLVPSNPVPIRGSDTAGLGGEALAGFGKALGTLGDVLDTAAQRARAENDKLVVLDATNQFRNAALKAKAERDAAAPIEGDHTGYQAVQEYQKEIQDPMNEIANNISDPEVRNQFLVKAGDITMDTSTLLLAGEVKKRTQANDSLMSKIVSENGLVARQDPSKIEEVMKATELMFRQNQDLPANTKEAAILDAKKGILQDALDGMIARSQKGANQFDLARASLEAHSAGIMSVEEKAKALDQINAADFHYHSRALQMDHLDEANFQKAQRETEHNLLGQYASQLQLAGFSDATREPILDNIQKDVAAGRISETKAAALIGAKSFQKAGEQKVSLDIMRTALETGNYDAALERVQTETGNSLEPGPDKSAWNLRQKLTQLKQASVENPLRSNNIVTSRAGLETLTEDTLNHMGGSSVDKQQVKEKVLGSYYKMLENPKANPEAAAMYAYEGILGKQVPTGNKSAEQLQQEAQSLFDERNAQMSRGLKVDDKDFATKLGLLKIQMNKVKAFQNTPVQSPITDPTATPSRRNR